MLTIELRRAHSPEEMDEPQSCGICGRPFVARSVIAFVGNIEGNIEGGGRACPSCMAYLHAANPDRFPSLEEFLGALERYPEPMFSSVQEILALEREDPDAAQAAYVQAWIR